MNDLISRKAAIEAVGDVHPMDYNGQAILHRLRELPITIIDPVKHGKWIWQDSPVFGNPYGSYMCPLCQNTMPHKTNYCPNCGAKMDGGEE